MRAGLFLSLLSVAAAQSWSFTSPLFYSICALVGLCCCLSACLAWRFHSLARATAQNAQDALDSTTKGAERDKQRATAALEQVRALEGSLDKERSKARLSAAGTGLNVAPASPLQPTQSASGTGLNAAPASPLQPTSPPSRPPSPPPPPATSPDPPAAGDGGGGGGGAGGSLPVSLPPGWFIKLSSTKGGKPYYVNPVLRLKLWSPPDATVLGKKLKETQEALTILRPPPAGPTWESIYSPEKRAHFFYNPRTGEKKWAAEGGALPPPPPPPAPKWLGPPLPPGWVPQWSKTKGKFYFFNLATKEKRWAWPPAPPAVSGVAAQVQSEWQPPPQEPPPPPVSVSPPHSESHSPPPEVGGSPVHTDSPPEVKGRTDSPPTPTALDPADS